MALDDPRSGQVTGRFLTIDPGKGFQRGEEKDLIYQASRGGMKPNGHTTGRGWKRGVTDVILSI